VSYVQPLISILLVSTFLTLLLKPGRARLLLGGFAFLGGLMLVLPVFDWVFSRPLEAGYAYPPAHLEEAQAIVVLSSSIRPPIPERPYYLPDRETYERCVFAAWLAKTTNALPIITSGGPERGGRVSNAAVMRDVLIGVGVPNSMIWLEEESRSTHENAVFTAALLRKHNIKKVLLVVEAQSMRRAEACFRKAGVDVLPAPSGRRKLGPFFREMWPNWRAISRNEITLHEVVALVWYRLRGWI